jgi:hypothetical protein
MTSPATATRTPRSGEPTSTGTSPVSATPTRFTPGTPPSATSTRLGPQPRTIYLPYASTPPRR